MCLISVKRKTIGAQSRNLPRGTRFTRDKKNMELCSVFTQNWGIYKIWHPTISRELWNIRKVFFFSNIMSFYLIATSAANSWLCIFCLPRSKLVMLFFFANSLFYNEADEIDIFLHFTLSSSDYAAGLTIVFHRTKKERHIYSGTIRPCLFKSLRFLDWFNWNVYRNMKEEHLVQL